MTPENRDLNADGMESAQTAPSGEPFALEPGTVGDPSAFSAAAGRTSASHKSKAWAWVIAIAGGLVLAGFIAVQTTSFLNEKSKHKKAEIVADITNSADNNEERHCKETLARNEKLYGANDLHVARSLRELAECYRRDNKFKEAQPLLVSLLSMSEKNSFREPLRAKYLSLLVQNERDLHEFESAESLLKQAIAAKEKMQGKGDLILADYLDDLGSLYKTENKLREAEASYKQALSIREQALGPDSTRLLSHLTDLADLYRREGREHDAEQTVARAKQIIRSQ